jgi:hypothetical protein
MGHLVGAGHDDEWAIARQLAPTDGKVRRPSGGGYAEHARLRQMGPKGVDAGCDAAGSAA